MEPMSKFDYSHLDGQLLQLLLAVLEEGSVTRAAQRLGVTQSAVSHLLDKLRGITGDPLFVKSGRGIVPTARAEALAQPARLLLEDMQRLATPEQFDPASLQACFTIAANDMQRDLLLPALLRRLRLQAPLVRLHTIPSGVPSAEMLRDGSCQLVLSPRPPDATDIVQKRLFETPYRVFYDARVRAAPDTLADYLASEHVSVLYHPRRMLDIDQWLQAQGVLRRMAATVPGFAGIAAFLQGSPWLASVPGLLGQGMLQGFASCALPLPCPSLPMYMLWHLRHQHDPVQRWLRQSLEATAAEVLPPSAQAVQPAAQT
nr:LysR family transcriptional regulator [Rhodoferax ferrireducens]